MPPIRPVQAPVRPAVPQQQRPVQQAAAPTPPRPAPAPTPQPGPRPAPQPAPQPTPSPAPPQQPSPPQQRNAQGEGQVVQGALSAVDAVAGSDDAAKRARSEAAKRSREKRLASMTDYPGLRDENGQAVLLQDVPTDYDAASHKPLKKADFSHPAIYLEWRAQEYDRLAAKMRQEAEIARTLPAQSQARGKRLAAVQAQYSALLEMLRAQGIDVDAMLAERGLSADIGNNGQAHEPQPQEQAQVA